MFLLRKVKLPLMSASKVKRKKWGQKKSLPGILFLILLMLVVFGGVSYKNGFFTIKRLDLKNSLDCVTIESLKRETGVINKSLFFINTLDLKKRIERDKLINNMPIGPAPDNSFTPISYFLV